MDIYSWIYRPFIYIMSIIIAIQQLRILFAVGTDFLTIYAIICTIFYLIFLVTAIIVKLFIYRTGTLEPKLPPGPRKLPLIGNFHQLVSKKTLPHHRLAELASVYGPIMHLQLGEISTIVISSADVAAEVMKTNDAVTCSRPGLLIAKELFYNSSDIAMAPYGEYWRQVRKISVLELFTAKRIESFRTIREEEVNNLREELSCQAGSVVNLSQKIFVLTFNIISRLAFSKKGKDQEIFRALTAAGSELACGFTIADFYPSLKLLHSVSGMKKKMQELVKGWDKVLDPIIHEHKTRKRERGIEEDILDVLLKSHKDNLNENATFFLTSENIKAITVELFGAGSDTSSSVLEWAMSELLKNPFALQKAQEEVRKVYEHGKVDETKLAELRFLKLVIKETLRLHPPGPLLVPRETIERCQIHGYDIPPKTRVITHAWAIARDPKYWPDPEIFNPQRFENSPVDYKGNHFELIPFGAGRRGCPGMGLGIANVELPLAMLLYHFDWKIANNLADKPEELDMDESFGITVRRKNELLVIPMPYSSCN